MNDFLSYMADKLTRDKGINPHTLSWNVAPVLNATCRSSNQEAKATVFKAFTDEAAPEDGLKVARKAHREQTDTVKRMFEELEPTLDMSHKVIVGFTEATDKEYIGLVANKVCGKYNKPCILLREANTTTWSGSLRSPMALKSIINKSKLAKVQGHEEAAGIILSKANLNKLIKYLDANLDLDVHPDTPVTCCIKPCDLTLNLCKLIENNKLMWGHCIEMPTFFLKAKFTPDNVAIFEKKTTTIKLTIDGVEFIKFMATPDEVEQVKDGGEIEMIVEAGVNEWNGVERPQGIIKQFEVQKELAGDDEDWEDMF